MSYRTFKAVCFGLEGLNAFATTFYFYYLFVFMTREFGFGNRENLFLSALYGLLYTFASLFAGRFGQRAGYFRALLIGFCVMACAMVMGAFTNSSTGQIAVMVFWTFGICFTWPNLEALVSEKESPSNLPSVLGIYNIVWAVAGAVAFFCGGALLERLGMRSLFWIPAGLHAVQLLILFWARTGLSAPPPAANVNPPSKPLPSLNPRPIGRARTFLKLAWIANPFAYVAVNTIVAVIPDVAKKLELTPTHIGFFCSIWFFARLATFITLWLWNGWHYKFGWFITSYILLIVGFGVILTVPSLWPILIAQIGFGIALGLLYYSSLFYSMDVGETKGEHGGFHEALIGAGIFAGPAIGAGAFYLFPETSHSGTVAVGTLLLIGLMSVLFVYGRGRRLFSHGPRKSA